MYSRVNKNIEAVISDDSVSEKELIYIKELSKFNRANLENAKQLIEYDNNNYDERKKLEKEIFEIYKEHIEFMSKAYEKSSPENLKLQMEVAKEENNITKESVDVVVKNCQVIFVAVPTPMKKSGECHTGIVESVLQDIQNAAIR